MDIHRRLEYLLTGLEMPYKYMLMTQIDLFYMSSASKQFQVVREARSSACVTPDDLLIRVHKLLQCRMTAPQFCFPLSHGYSRIMPNHMEVQCSGRLEICNSGENHLQPMDQNHFWSQGPVSSSNRRIYLEKEVLNMLVSRNFPPTFYQVLTLLRSFVLLLTSTPGSLKFKALGQTVMAVLRHASRFKGSFNFGYIPPLDKLAEMMDHHVRKLQSNEAGA